MRLDRRIASLSAMSEKCLELGTRIDLDPLASISKNYEKVINKIDESWSKSYAGYHALVYYQDFQHPGEGEYFDQEWGRWVGPWTEYTEQQVFDEIEERTKDLDINRLVSEANDCTELFSECRTAALGLAEILSSIVNDPTSIHELIKELKELYCKILSSDFMEMISPRSVASRDRKATLKGLQYPPHLKSRSWLFEQQSCFRACKEVGELSQRVIAIAENTDVQATKRKGSAKGFFVKWILPALTHILALVVGSLITLKISESEFEREVDFSEQIAANQVYRTVEFQTRECMSELEKLVSSYQLFLDTGIPLGLEENGMNTYRISLSEELAYLDPSINNPIFQYHSLIDSYEEWQKSETNETELEPLALHYYFVRITGTYTLLLGSITLLQELGQNYLEEFPDYHDQLIEEALQIIEDSDETVHQLQTRVIDNISGTQDSLLNKTRELIM